MRSRPSSIGRSDRSKQGTERDSTVTARGGPAILAQQTADRQTGRQAGLNKAAATLNLRYQNKMRLNLCDCVFRLQVENFKSEPSPCFVRTLRTTPSPRRKKIRIIFSPLASTIPSPTPTLSFRQKHLVWLILLSFPAASFYHQLLFDGEKKTSISPPRRHISLSYSDPHHETTIKKITTTRCRWGSVGHTLALLSLPLREVPRFSTSACRRWRCPVKQGEGYRVGKNGFSLIFILFSDERQTPLRSQYRTTKRVEHTSSGASEVWSPFHNSDHAQPTPHMAWYALRGSNAKIDTDTNSGRVISPVSHVYLYVCICIKYATSVYLYVQHNKLRQLVASDTGGRAPTGPPSGRRRGPCPANQS